jgi:glycerol kinase
VARAAFESIAFQVRDALDAMRTEAGVPLGRLHADGGPTTSAFLMQLTADLTGADLRVATMPDCSALGAVLAGRLGLGLTGSIAGSGRSSAFRNVLSAVDGERRVCRADGRLETGGAAGVW